VKISIEFPPEGHLANSIVKIIENTLHSATVILPNSSVIECMQKGTMRVRFYSTLHIRYFTVALLNTLVVPSLRLQLVSTNRLSESGHIVQFDAVGIQLTLCASSPAPVIICLPHSFKFCSNVNTHQAVHHRTSRDAAGASTNNVLHSARIVCNMYDEMNGLPPSRDDAPLPNNNAGNLPHFLEGEAESRLRNFESSMRQQNPITKTS
jgi:hypothetical protein